MGKRTIYLILLSLLAISLSVCAATLPNLNDEIKEADKRFFKAFNSCDMDTMASIFSNELEFYHDQGGLGDYATNMKAIKDLCARNLGLVRTLLDETTEIYPVPNFGAIQVGQHRFCHDENGKPDCGTFHFTHVWKQTDGGWRLHRVLSYGH